MDINELYTAEAHEKGAEMRVLDQHGKKTDLYITFVGVDSKAWRDISKQKMRVMISQLSGKDKGELEEISQASIYASAATGWRGFMSGGKKLKFSEETALTLFSQAPYIADQAEKFISQRANFIQS